MLNNRACPAKPARQSADCMNDPYMYSSTSSRWLDFHCFAFLTLFTLHTYRLAYLLLFPVQLERSH